MSCATLGRLLEPVFPLSIKLALKLYLAHRVVMGIKQFSAHIALRIVPGR